MRDCERRPAIGEGRRARLVALQALELQVGKVRVRIRAMGEAQGLAKRARVSAGGGGRLLAGPPPPCALALNALAQAGGW